MRSKGIWRSPCEKGGLVVGRAPVSWCTKETLRDGDADEKHEHEDDVQGGEYNSRARGVHQRGVGGRP